MATQAQLPLRVHARTVLVAIETARAITGLDHDSIAARAGDELAWVFDLAAGPVSVARTGIHSEGPAGVSAEARRRELRFWLPELQAWVAEQPFLPEWEEFERAVAPGKGWLHSGAVSQVLCITRPTLARLAATNEIRRRQAGGIWQIERESLLAFLRRRQVSADNKLV